MCHFPIQVLDQHCMVELVVINKRKNTEQTRKNESVHNKKSQSLSVTAHQKSQEGIIKAIIPALIEIQEKNLKQYPKVARLH